MTCTSKLIFVYFWESQELLGLYFMHAIEDQTRREQMKKILTIVFLLILTACSNQPPIVTDTPAAPTAVSEDAPYLPNPAWQPGAYNPDVTQDTIQTTICVSGYSKSIRPPASYTDALKVQQIAQYGYSDTNTADYEEDHLIALEDGGNPTDPKNLWPQPRHTTPWSASQKDTLENTLHHLVCSSQLPLDEARQALAIDWVAAYQKYIGQSLVPITPVPTEP